MSHLVKAFKGSKDNNTSPSRGHSSPTRSLSSEEPLRSGDTDNDTTNEALESDDFVSLENDPQRNFPGLEPVSFTSVPDYDPKKLTQMRSWSALPNIHEMRLALANKDRSSSLSSEDLPSALSPSSNSSKHRRGLLSFFSKSDLSGKQGAREEEHTREFKAARIPGREHSDDERSGPHLELGSARAHKSPNHSEDDDSNPTSPRLDDSDDSCPQQQSTKKVTQPEGRPRKRSEYVPNDTDNDSPLPIVSHVSPRSQNSPSQTGNIIAKQAATYTTSQAGLKPIRSETEVGTRSTRTGADENLVVHPQRHTFSASATSSKAELSKSHSSNTSPSSPPSILKPSTLTRGIKRRKTLNAVRIDSDATMRELQLTVRSLIKDLNEQDTVIAEMRQALQHLSQEHAKALRLIAAMRAKSPYTLLSFIPFLSNTQRRAGTEVKGDQSDADLSTDDLQFYEAESASVYSSDTSSLSDVDPSGSWSSTE